MVLVALIHSLTQGLGPDWLKPIRMPKLLVRMIGLGLGTEDNHSPGDERIFCWGIHETEYSSSFLDCGVRICELWNSYSHVATIRKDHGAHGSYQGKYLNC